MAPAPSALHRLEIVKQVGSTNGELLARLSRGEALREGDWLVADRQVAGRGRLGREWQDGAGNFMGSTVVAIGAGDPPAHTLALVAGVAVHRAAAELLPDAAGLTLKWPNDLLLDGAKLAGILLERRGDHVVVGVGVNLVQAPKLADRQTVALADIGLAVPRDDFADALARTFADELASWRSSGLHQTLAQWTQRGPIVGTRLVVNPATEDRLTGQYRGLDPAGALLLRLAGGADRAIHAGEVELLRNEED
ncbi:biotin--[acetyl-CoA-carboxylase] ligase [Croceicoccus marinus]|jgi:BirA family biotin operon repressor/biotin-[acetyl-CoA-carboxylase] ligase|uniref:biotin--[biotin carboxyl-carrier protein] ligase n=1 Tax=Croceicoccus marinus TaxID=450378 RepID=A0A7G6VRK9_9SPHN|nr:biotin--[acetyl-CoA-carboxylase] ligase [Croceicoccus marinus]QNE04374.1 biotin--[acetyl-CoA-carboxylase] ligase [Croceicoccus marinus]